MWCCTLHELLQRKAQAHKILATDRLLQVHVRRANYRVPGHRDARRLNFDAHLDLAVDAAHYHPFVGAAISLRLPGPKVRRGTHSRQW